MCDKMIEEKPIEEVMKESYLTYAMSVIVSRALPDIRDGLKPVHRRIIYAMYEINNTHDKPFKKSARVVGEVLGKYHPHGDAAIYDALVRMAQPFSMRYPLVEGQGNFGSIDGDSPAAMRYTEVRLSRLSSYLLQDIEKETVSFSPNFDNTLKEPDVLPSKFPNLLINGSSGIAVGLSTNIPPHNLNEIVDALIAMIDNNGDVYEIVKGPDFPTGGIILGKEGIRKAYTTGKGIIKIRAKTEIKDNKILITEIPYQVTKAKIIEEIVKAVNSGRIEGIRDLHDKSDKRGLLIEIKLKPSFNPEVVLNKLFEYTSLEVSYGIINVALVNGQPKLLTLEEMLRHFLSFRFEVIRKRTSFLLKKAKERQHIVNGLLKALERVEKVVELIKSSKDREEAISKLKALLSIDDKQALAILEMKLSRLISLERKKLFEEAEKLKKEIEEYLEILEKDEKVYEIIKEELLEIKEKFGDKRRTEIVESYEERDIEDLIPDKEVIIAYEDGYLKRLELSSFRLQRRGGKGIHLEAKRIAKARNLDEILFFTNHGKVYSLKAYVIPKASRYSKGKPIRALLKLSEGEEVVAFLSVRELSGYLLFLTAQGVVKKTSADEFKHIRGSGIRAILLRQNDSLADVKVVKQDIPVVISTLNGKGICFSSSKLRPMGRVSHGVKGIKLEEGDRAISLSPLEKPFILLVTNKGYGKRLSSSLKQQNRGGKGMILIKLKQGERLVKTLSIEEKEQVVVVTKKGKSIRFSISSVPVLSRYARGVKLVDLDKEDEVIGVALIEGE